jgi:hypothetical protein
MGRHHTHHAGDADIANNVSNAEFVGVDAGVGEQYLGNKYGILRAQRHDPVELFGVDIEAARFEHG